MKRMILAGLLLALAVPAWAGGYYLDGRYCYNVGNTLYCDGGSSGSSSHSNRQRMEDQAEREDIQRRQGNAALLADCLRKADWPGMPGTTQCYQLYGGQ